MSGLDPDRCRILEIATLVTDANLELVAEGPDIVVHQPPEVLAAMDEWCTQHHGSSGLTEQVQRSTTSEAEAERQTLEFIAQYTQKGSSPLCGNSVWQDRRFLARSMPTLEGWLHYRLIDVSTVKELVRRWYPGLTAPAKAEAHRALGDIHESIAELRFYREHVFR